MTSSFSLRTVDPESDADLLLRWVTEDRAAFWGMQDADRGRVVEVYAWIADQPHLAAYVVRHRETPLALFQTYDPAVDEVGQHYDRREGDLGVHLLLAGDPARAGRTPALVGFLLDHCFADPAVQRLVVEPDVRNAKSVALMQRVGFRLGPVVPDLPTPGGGTKPAQLAFLERSDASPVRHVRHG